MGAWCIRTHPLQQTVAVTKFVALATSYQQCPLTVSQQVAAGWRREPHTEGNARFLPCTAVLDGRLAPQRHAPARAQSK
eukprot:CAMPEP_0183366896 /NCGR_PEP_ID=MMETSP0164_2-20130417/90522_1 /TAXON_ID=221442 /ORGANISM="Coccolithus pelagicus ssp braarudi, Strain PLY182g" /LENGTH=78 /DNA_ID=CAMNT_0025542733 /DNA_START=188 /DNA_END=424 /DNA_ORIENTATION=+